MDSGPNRNFNGSSWNPNVNLNQLPGSSQSQSQSLIPPGQYGIRHLIDQSQSSRYFLDADLPSFPSQNHSQYLVQYTQSPQQIHPQNFNGSSWDPNPNLNQLPGSSQSQSQSLIPPSQNAIPHLIDQSQSSRHLLDANSPSFPSQNHSQYFVQYTQSPQQIHPQPFSVSQSQPSLSTFSQNQSLPSSAHSLSVGQVQVSQSYSQIKDEERNMVIKRIEEQIASIVTALSQDQLPVMIESSPTFSGKVKETKVDFGKENSRKKFTVLIAVMSRAHSLLMTGKTLTNRDLFYENKPLFEKQDTVDEAIKSICNILKVSIESLPYESSVKGLVAGGENVQLMQAISDSKSEKVVISSTGSLVPRISVLRGWGKFTSNARFILIVEKDAIFQRLIDLKVFDKFDPFILITGKGFADRATRAFASKLSSDLGIPSFALVDGDPFGLLIAVHYKYGPQKLMWATDIENSLVLPSLIIIGVLPSDFEKLTMKQNDQLPFGPRDDTILDTLVGRLTELDDQRLLEEVNVLKSLKYKVEIEAVANLGGIFFTYLQAKISQHLNM